MKQLLKKVFFGADKSHKILAGVSAGMRVNYDPRNRSLHLLGLYEREIYPFLRKSIKRAETLIDIGANDGYYALAFVRHKGKEVILCEPGSIRDEMRNNLALNGFVENSDFIVVDKLVSNVNTDSEISINELLKNKTSVFILMDVDGGEQVIMESFKCKENAAIDWLIETHSAELEKNVSAILERHGYKVHIIKNAWWRAVIPEQRPLAHNRWLYASKTP